MAAVAKECSAATAEREVNTEVVVKDHKEAVEAEIVVAEEETDKFIPIRIVNRVSNDAVFFEQAIRTSFPYNAFNF